MLIPVAFFPHLHVFTTELGDTCQLQKEEKNKFTLWLSEYQKIRSDSKNLGFWSISSYSVFACVFEFFEVWLHFLDAFLFGAVSSQWTIISKGKPHAPHQTVLGKSRVFIRIKYTCKHKSTGKWVSVWPWGKAGRDHLVDRKQYLQPAAVPKCGWAGVPAPHHVPLKLRGRVERWQEVIWAVITVGTLLPKREAQSNGAEEPIQV